MDKDIAPALIKKINEQFDEEIKNNQKIKSILEKQQMGVVDYTDSFLFAKEVGLALKKSIKQNISEDTLPNGRMYYNIAQRILGPQLKKNYDLISSQCKITQTILNQKAHIGLNALVPEYNIEKTRSIINYISNADRYSTREKSFLNALETNAKSIVDDSVRENADFHYRSGLRPKIVRTSIGRTCKWCQEVAGSYNYEDVKDTGNNVFRRHANCDCTVVYDPRDGSKKVQDVHSKIWKSAQIDDKMKIYSNDNLTKKERSAILRYFSSEAYKLNELMRNSKDLPNDLQELHDNLLSALDKLPKYIGDINRSLLFYNKEEIENFISTHDIGNIVEYNQFLSFSSEIYDENDSVRIKIFDSKNSVDLREYNKAEMETLYKPSQRFIVKDKYFEGGKPIIVLEELI